MRYPLILADGEEWESLRPLTFTRSVASLRMGVLTFSERWTKLVDQPVQIQTKEYIQPIYDLPTYADVNLFINPAFLPNEQLLSAIEKLQPGEGLFWKRHKVAGVCTATEWMNKALKEKHYLGKELIHIQRGWDLFTHNSTALSFDFDLLTKNRESQPLSTTNRTLGHSIFLEPGAKVEFAILNAEPGPIYIGANAEIQEGSLVRGGLALCSHAKLNMGAKIYGATTIGPYCKVGGEVNNSILTGFSNKGHEGFLGNSVLGEWCNLGADTNNSNLKNNYSPVRMWDYKTEKEIETNLLFCGLLMGDFSKSAINSQFNTGTTVGVGANIFTSGFPPKLIPHFSWGGEKDAPQYEFNRFCAAANAAMLRRNKTFSLTQKKLFSYLFDNP